MALDRRTKLYKRSRRATIQWLSILALFVTTLSWVAITYAETIEPVSPRGPLTDSTPALIQLVEAQEETPGLSADELIDLNCHRFFKEERKIQYCKFQMHCLYWKETRNGLNKDAHGDGGMAGGYFQFWQQTYVNARHDMILQGHVKDTGSRYDLENAIETTAWMLSEGRGSEYGPILRGECK